ncbi:GNAT family N-acetyltransferase [Nocardia sp. NPDC050799]|uniref:GNAT family N-acetyltransferase n=1 Tax=Nocardia sp. NPDC050799 TaxID=3154842 RepID=UPI0033D9B841
MLQQGGGNPLTLVLRCCRDEFEGGCLGTGFWDGPEELVPEHEVSDLRREFLRTIPAAGDATASLEFVGTSSHHQGRGVATALLTHLLALPRYREYLLEDIADTNTTALALYERLGFVEYKRRKVHHTKRTGINHYISMKLVQN